jgi:hypothetical protein
MPRARAASSRAATVGWSATLPAAPGGPALETSLDNSGSPEAQPGADFSAREVLRLAWPLFQQTLLRCLPLGVLAAAASAVPNAEAAARRAAGAPQHDREWWMLLVAVTALVLICYGAVLRIQLHQARGERQDVMAALRSALASLPATLAFLLMAFAPLLPPAMWMSMRGPDLIGVLLLLAAVGGVLLMFFGWPAIVAQGLSPWAAVRRSILLVRSRYLQVMAVVGLLLASVLVFALLASIFIGSVIMLAGPAAQSSQNWLAVSRWLMAGVLALPIVYAGAVSIAAWRCVAEPPGTRSSSLS